MSQIENEAFDFEDPEVAERESKGSGRKWERLIAARKAKGLTQQQMADAIGVSLVTYNRWENRLIPPEAAWPFIKMSKELGVSMDYLFSQDRADYSVEDKEALVKAAEIILRHEKRK